MLLLPLLLLVVVGWCWLLPLLLLVVVAVAAAFAAVVVVVAVAVESVWFSKFCRVHCALLYGLLSLHPPSVFRNLLSRNCDPHLKFLKLRNSGSELGRACKFMQRNH